jgi:hypothetical protein
MSQLPGSVWCFVISSWLSGGVPQVVVTDCWTCGAVLVDKVTHTGLVHRERSEKENACCHSLDVCCARHHFM